jgi:hypothetical protein
MPNAIKYSTTIPTGSLLKGTVALGVNTADILGPTSTTGWYYGPEPVAGKYQIIETAASGDPDVYCPQSDAELIQFVKSKGATGGNTGSVAAALAWIATQPNLLATNEVYPNIITSGSVLMLDAGFVGSYPTTASTWYDVSGNNINGTLTNGPTFNSNGAIVFDGVDDYVNCNNNSNPLLNPGPSEAWSLSATFKNSQPLPNDNAIYGIAGKRIDNGRNGYTLMLRGGIYNGVLARLSTFNGLGDNLVDIIPTTNYRTILSNGNYHQMVMTYGTNDTGSLYIDGVLVGQSIAPNFNFNNTSSAFKIGVGDTNNNFPFNGNINSVSFYNKALTQAEISQNYYQAPIVTNGLVLALDAGNIVSYESGSTITNSMTGSLTGSLINGTGYSNINGGTWNFDGVDDYITLGTQTLVTNDFSLNIWFNSTSNVAKEHFIISFGYASSNSFLLTQDTQNNGQSVLQAYYSVNGAVTGRSIATSTYPNTSIINICFVRQNGVNTPYINGVPQTDKIFTENVTLGSLTYILGWALPRNKSTAYMQGNIYNCSIYNRALSATEVTQNYNAQKGRFGL